MGDAYERSKECYGADDHSGAGYWSQQGKALKVQLSEINREKTRLIAELKKSDQNFDLARKNYLAERAKHDATEQAFSERLETVRKHKAAKVAARAQRLASGKPDSIDRGERDAIKKASELTQFSDDDLYVEFEQGYDADHQCSVNSFYIFHRDPSIAWHVHAIFREDTGEELLCEYHPDTRR